MLGKISLTDDHILGTPSGRNTSRTVKRQERGVRRHHAHRTRLNLNPTVHVPRSWFLRRDRFVDLFEPTAVRKACATRGGAHTPETRLRLEKCFADAQVAAGRLYLEREDGQEALSHV